MLARKCAQYRPFIGGAAVPGHADVDVQVHARRRPDAPCRPADGVHQIGTGHSEVHVRSDGRREIGVYRVQPAEQRRVDSAGAEGERLGDRRDADGARAGVEHRPGDLTVTEGIGLRYGQQPASGQRDEVLGVSADRVVLDDELGDRGGHDRHSTATDVAPAYAESTPAASCYVDGVGESFNVGKIGDIGEDEALVVPRETVGTQDDIAVVYSGGQYFAIDNTCTHEETGLADGWIENGCVECPLHSSSFRLADGAGLSPPAPRGVATHGIEVVGDALMLTPNPERLA